MTNVIPATHDALAAAMRTVNRVVQPTVILTGNPGVGFTVIGPFAALEDAARYIDSTDAEGWVLPLLTPEDGK